MLLVFVMIFASITFVMGGYASTRVQHVRDFIIAGRSLPLLMSMACVFATWMGAGTVLSVSTIFLQADLRSAPGDPWGATTCLLLVAFFFRQTFYRLRLVTIGDYYKIRYGSVVEWIASISIVWSCLGWTTAQFSALGMVIDALFPEVLPHQAILLGAMIVTAYTMFGGMWSIALTNVFQSIIMVIGLITVAVLLGREAGGIGAVLTFARRDTSVNLFPESTLAGWLSYLGAFLTIALGSIPQQDVFQRVTCAKDERTALIGTITGSLGYCCMALVLLFTLFAGQMLEQGSLSHDHGSSASGLQHGLTSLILDELPPAGRVLFLGAILSAILSTASGSLLASTSLLTENVFSMFTRRIDEAERVWVARYILIAFSVLTTSMALNAKSSLWEMVEGGYRVTLVVAFVPLLCGIYWPRATTQGALLSFIFSIPTWIAAELSGHQLSSEFLRLVPPQLYGLGASCLGMVLGSMLPSLVTNKQHLAHQRLSQA